MTTDTAVRVTRTVIHQKGTGDQIPPKERTHSETFEQVSLKNISYIDHPDLRIDEHESTEMPFRYMADCDGLPIMPKV